MSEWFVGACIATLAAVIFSSRPLIAMLQGTLAARERMLIPEGESADVAIILGYALFRDGSITAPLKGRVEHGVKAWEKGLGRHIILSGAHPGDGLRARTEASAMLAYALLVHKCSQKPDSWLLEEQSTSTRENALFSLAIVKDRGWKKVLVVTNTFHQLRSYWVFKKAAKELGFSIQVSMARLPFVGHEGWPGGPVGNTVMDHVDFWRELAAIACYKMRGYL